MEGSGVGNAVCIVHVDVSYVVGGCNVVATEHGRYGLSCMQSNCVYEQCWICMVCWSLSCSQRTKNHHKLKCF